MAKRPVTSWSPPEWDLADIHAVRSVANGTATEDQQRRAMRWIVERAADTYGPSYFGNSAEDVAHHEGRRFVGLQIVKFTNMPGEVLAKLGSSNGGREQP